jgi:hypothetical protein
VAYMRDVGGLCAIYGVYGWGMYVRCVSGSFARCGWLMCDKYVADVREVSG